MWLQIRSLNAVDQWTKFQTSVQLPFIAKVQICMRMRPSFCKGPPDGEELWAPHFAEPTKRKNIKLIDSLRVMEFISPIRNPPPNRVEDLSLRKACPCHTSFFDVSLSKDQWKVQVASWKRVIHVPTPIVGLAEASNLVPNHNEIISKKNSGWTGWYGMYIYIYTILCGMYVQI